MHVCLLAIITIHLPDMSAAKSRQPWPDCAHRGTTGGFASHTERRERRHTVVHRVWKGSPPSFENESSREPAIERRQLYMLWVPALNGGRGARQICCGELGECQTVDPSSFFTSLLWKTPKEMCSWTDSSRKGRSSEMCRAAPHGACRLQRMLSAADPCIHAARAEPGHPAR